MDTKTSLESMLDYPNQRYQKITVEERKKSPIANGLLDTTFHHCKFILSIGKIGYFVGYNVVAAVGAVGGGVYGALKYLKTFPNSNRTKSLSEYCIDGAIKVNSSSFLKSAATVVGALACIVKVAALSPTFLMFNIGVLIYSILRTCLVAYEFGKRGESKISNAAERFWAASDLLQLNNLLHGYINKTIDRVQAKKEVLDRFVNVLCSLKDIVKAYFLTIRDMVKEVPRLVKAALPASVVKKLESKKVEEAPKPEAAPVAGQQVKGPVLVSRYTQANAAVQTEAPQPA